MKSGPDSKIVVVGDRKIITWELPVGITNIQKNISDDPHTTMFKHQAPIEDLHASISPNFDYIALGEVDSLKETLSIYDIHSGRKLAVARSAEWWPGFTLDGNQVWCATASNEVDQWAIFKDKKANTIKLDYLGTTE